MSFNRLPNETQQLVVDMCYRADQAYKERGGKQSKYGWTGRSLSAVSMVNRRLRDMSEKYLFSTLRFSKSEDPIFLYSILPSPKVNRITTIKFDTGPKTTSDSLVSFILRIPHLLPNLSSVDRFNHAVTKELPAGSLSSTEPVFQQGSEIASVLKTRQIRSALLAMASRTTRWNVSVRFSELVPLLERNLSHITDLTLKTPGRKNTLASEEPELAALLSRLTSLRTLSIEHGIPAAFSDTNLHDSAFAYRYPFSTTLRSLVLDLELSCRSTVPNEFKFAALFPQLQYLKLYFRSKDLKEIESLTPKSFTFPNLTHADFVNCPIDYLSTLSDVLDFPSIQELQFLYNLGYQDEEEEDPLASLDFLHKSLSSTPFTLRHLRVDLPYDYRNLQEICDTRTAVFFAANRLRIFDLERSKSSPTSSENGNTPAERSIDALHFNINAPSASTLSTEKQDEEEEEEEKEEIVEKRETSAIGSARDLARWISERVETVAIGEDEAGAKELLGMLEEVENLKNWIQD